MLKPLTKYTKAELVIALTQILKGYGVPRDLTPDKVNYDLDTGEIQWPHREGE